MLIQQLCFSLTTWCSGWPAWEHVILLDKLQEVGFNRKWRPAQVVLSVHNEAVVSTSRGAVKCPSWGFSFFTQTRVTHRRRGRVLFSCPCSQIQNNRRVSIWSKVKHDCSCGVLQGYVHLSSFDSISHCLWIHPLAVPHYPCAGLRVWRGLYQLPMSKRQVTPWKLTK